MVTNNAQNLIKQVLSSGNTVGLLQAKDVGGTVRYIADFSTYPSVVEDTFTLVANNAGISVGSNTTTPTTNDYQLLSTITSGLSGSVTSTSKVDENNNASITFGVTIRNTSNTAISISEIGYKQTISATNIINDTVAVNRVFLLDRSTFETITIAPNDFVVIDYTLKAVISNSGGVEGIKTITTNGIYNAIDDEYDGYSTVTVNVSPNVGTKNITENGTYNASTDNLDGFSQVTVNVSGGSSVLGTKTVTQNGTYTALDDNYDGYSEVTVNVLGGKSDILATPRMTSNTTPSGVVSASSNYGVNYLPYYAFSESCGMTTYTWLSDTDDAIGAWIQYEFPQAEIITKLITINRGESTTRAVKTFIFQGSNNETTWTDIENCSISSNASFHREEYLLDNSTAYRYYRLYITSAWETNPRWVGFAQIQMYKECVVSTKTVTQNGTYNAFEDDIGGYSQVVVAVDNYISKDITVYEFITLDNTGQNASIRVNKYINGVLDYYTDVTYNSVASTPRNFDDYLTLDYGITTSYYWTYTLLRSSKTKDINATYSWFYGDNVILNEQFADFICEPKTITQNGIYYASGDNYDGYSRVIVDVENGEQSAIQITSYAEETSISKGNANSMINITAMIDSIIEEV